MSCQCYFIPPYMQEHIKNHCGTHLPDYYDTLYTTHFNKSAEFRRLRVENIAIDALDKTEVEERPGVFATNRKINTQTGVIQIFDANHKKKLPGKLVKDNLASTKEKVPLRPDVSVNRAYDSSKKIYDFYSNIFQRDSIDGKGMPLLSTVHFDRNYDNAFWDGKHMVYGDGDQEVFADFTLDLDVSGHEMTHGVTEHTINLEYANQSGALNEHVSDAFGSMIKQYSLQQTVDKADWLIGDKILLGAGALRSMKAPGTAYNTPLLGKDPQPGTMGGYVNLPNNEANDNGGVHINSGIPNHAFYFVCTGLGGYSWEKAGKIWYETLHDPNLKSTSNFKDFANSTILSAKNLAKGNREWTGKEEDVVRKAWKQVEVLL